jgi:hypothetical protein
MTWNGLPLSRMVFPTGSIWPKSRSAILALRMVTRAWVRFSTRVNDRPTRSPPETRSQFSLRPAMATDSSRWSSNWADPPAHSSRSMNATDGREATTAASSTVRSGRRRQGLISSEPSDTVMPPEK